MPALRKLSRHGLVLAAGRLARRPHSWLALLAAIVGLALLDAARPPGRQVTASSAAAAVRAYQVVGRPLLEGRVRCRMRPSCSEYALEALREQGSARGGLLIARRLASCRAAVPMGTPDPVPASVSSARAD